MPTSFRNPSKSFRTMTAVAIEIPRIFARVPMDALCAATGRCKATVRNWIEGRTQPSASDLMLAIQNFDEIASEVDAVTGRKRVTEYQRQQMLKALELARGTDEGANRSTP